MNDVAADAPVSEESGSKPDGELEASESAVTAADDTARSPEEESQSEFRAIRAHHTKRSRRQRISSEVTGPLRRPAMQRCVAGFSFVQDLRVLSG